MKVRVTRDFYDLANNDTLRKVGDEFIVSQERFEEILSVGDFVDEIKETKKSTKKKAGADDGVMG